MFAGYAAAVMMGIKGMPIWLMVLMLAGGMIVLGFVLERGILRPMVGQPLVSVIMVTIGLSFVLKDLSPSYGVAVRVNSPCLYVWPLIKWGLRSFRQSTLWQPLLPFSSSSPSVYSSRAADSG